MKKVVKASYQDGYNKAMELMNYDTYMYDSSKRLYELSKKDLDYAFSDNNYRSGFAQAVYKMHRC